MKLKFYQRVIRQVVVFIVLIFMSTTISEAQTYLYFQDSPSTEFYDYSWMELTAPSELERKNTDLRKFPVESVITAQQGVNSLRLKWRSNSGGSWLAIAAGDGWNDNDISAADKLIFWLQSVEGISKADLPNVFMEDVSNKKSNFHSLRDYSDDLVAGVWTKISIPMTVFLNAGDGVDFTKIKTIGFAQNASDGVEHTLLIDDMRVIVGDGTYPAVNPPAGVIATAYEYHIEVSWDFNQETFVSAYQIERSLDGGLNFTTIKVLDDEERIYIDWVKDLGETVEASYRVKAINEGNETSDPSSVVTATTSSMTDDELLDMVQKYTFRYFWDFAHEASGMSRERNTSGNVVTSGGSGFGIMSIPVGIERGFITREEGVERVLKILNFLSAADRFHGAWSHWINGNTGVVIPFSPNDNGGDIVETSFMAQGLLTIRQYFNGESADEQQIVQLATELWEGIEWDWYRKNASSSIYWHWSSDLAWTMNMKVSGWNEAAIVYLLAIASPTYSVPSSLWETGWVGNNYANIRTIYDHKLYVGADYGGPMFFAHYSFLGFDPRDKADKYANYFDQNRNQSLVQQAYSIDNPKGFEGYSAESWGLTASDDPAGYLAHEPNSSRDNGTISPTAALSSFPYTPEESMLALKHFYRNLGEDLWGWMGFKDAFNESRDWVASSYLAIDQGPIILMIENYRTQLLWDNFMSNSEIQPMMDAIGFSYLPSSTENLKLKTKLSVFPNPSSSVVRINFLLDYNTKLDLDIYDLRGRKVFSLISDELYESGEHAIEFNASSFEPGIYFAKMRSGKEEFESLKIVIQ